MDSGLIHFLTATVKLIHTHFLLLWSVDVICIATWYISKYIHNSKPSLHVEHNALTQKIFKNQVTGMDYQCCVYPYPESTSTQTITHTAGI